MKKTIQDYELENKTVIIRCDFNVPMKDGSITDNNRIVSSLKTIRYAIDHHAKVVLMSHLGRIKSEEDKKTRSLKPVAEELADLLNMPIKFVNTTHGEILEESIKELEPGEVLLMENTRFEDVPGNFESKNNPELGTYWASLGDIYINDAFGTSHRAHASNVGIASHLPSGVGFLVEKELEVMKEALENPEHPFVAILGGAKVSDKIGVIQNLVHIADKILVGGGIANTFLKAKGYEVGKSLVDDASIDFCKDMISAYPDKIILPIDVVTSTEVSDDTPIKKISVTEIEPEDIVLDIGSKTVELYKTHLHDSATIVWNGTVGMTELNNFIHGTEALCDIISKEIAITIIGGGDTAGAVIGLGYQEKMSHISTGGGASLELLEGKKLPGIEAISD